MKVLLLHPIVWVCLSGSEMGPTPEPVGTLIWMQIWDDQHQRRDSLCSSPLISTSNFHLLVLKKISQWEATAAQEVALWTRPFSVTVSGRRLISFTLYIQVFPLRKDGNSWSNLPPVWNMKTEHRLCSHVSWWEHTSHFCFEVVSSWPQHTLTLFHPACI